jgi:aryl-alcohol dehydrogenase (NADP+)
MAKLEAIEALLPVAEDAGVPLSHLALAFVLTHPAVTSAIIGPRTMEQMVDALGAVDVALSDVTLDRIDAVVAPGVTLDPEDAGWTPPSLSDVWRRRRPEATRRSSS